MGDWQTNLARFSLAVDAGCRFARGRLDGDVAPCCRSIARDALRQAKNRSPVHLLAHFRTRPDEMFRLVFLQPSKYSQPFIAYKIIPDTQQLNSENINDYTVVLPYHPRRSASFNLASK